MKAQGIFGPYMLLLVGSALLASAGAVRAQNTPLTGKLLQEPAVAAKTAPTPAAQPAVVSASATAQPAVAAAQAAAPVQSPQTSAPTGPETRIRIGDVTHTLLQAQADGRVAGPRLPMLGATADVSWQRYLDSFRHPLPEFFKNTVSKETSN
ncbi:MAG: hypothetical protein JWQ61_4406 [Collimonas fungivorans]|uniref:DUF3613 domain-containing protein n=1 Tax=Collimonas fungivorans TaxID=158899 RepID=UPI0026F0D707|nr:DUF3613 domain-containing protein [Collimonas fungivorans]MDB5769592.1 hypothetical protein [Collimonas fungivorans]